MSQGYYQPLDPSQYANAVNPPGTPAAAWVCPFCRYQGAPVVTSKTATGGWVMFVVLLLMCFPVCWLGLLIREQYRKCPQCQSRFG